MDDIAKCFENELKKMTSDEFRDCTPDDFLICLYPSQNRCFYNDIEIDIDGILFEQLLELARKAPDYITYPESKDKGVEKRTFDKRIERLNAVFKAALNNKDFQITERKMGLGYKLNVDYNLIGISNI